jgi:DNA primase
MTITPQWKDELRARITLSTVVQRTTKLTKAGREWKACCPFHNENTPSFYVNDEKQFYHCFGCGAHGDVITWMIEQRGFSFMDAIKELAEEAGMEVPKPDPVAAKKAEKRAELVDVTTAAQDWFVDRLKGPEGSEALQYLRGRGLSDATLREFGFGYAPEDKQALSNALSRFEPDMLAESGMRIVTNDGKAYDRFRGRVMLPIQDARGRVIAFGGRILEKRDGVAKYLNSPDTPLFDKGRTLYNHHRAAPASRQTGRVIVVEGYMDVVALAQAGFHDAVAPLGTALTETQLEMLWRMVEMPVLCFDGDNAGQRAAMRAIGRALPMLAPMRSLKIVRLPTGMDPDDLIKAQGPLAMEKLLESASSLLDFLWEAERDAQPLTSPEAKAGLKARLMEHVNTIEDGDIRALYRRELLKRFSDFAFPRSPLKRFTRKKYAANDNNYQSGLAYEPGYPPFERAREESRAYFKRIGSGKNDPGLQTAVVHGLVRHRDQIEPHLEAMTDYALLEESFAPLLNIVIDVLETLDSSDTEAIFGKHGLPAPPAHLKFAFLREGTDPGEAREELAEAVALLVQKPALEAALARTIARFDEDPEGCFAEQGRLRTQLIQIEDRLKAFGRRRAASAGTGDADDDASRSNADKAA